MPWNTWPLYTWAVSKAQFTDRGLTSHQSRWVSRSQHHMMLSSSPPTRYEIHSLWICDEGYSDKIVVRDCWVTAVGGGVAARPLLPKNYFAVRLHGDEWASIIGRHIVLSYALKVSNSLFWFLSRSSSRLISSSWSSTRALSFRLCQSCMLSSAEICNKHQISCHIHPNHKTNNHLEGSDKSPDLTMIRINLCDSLVFNVHRFQKGARGLLLNEFRYLC